MKLLNAYLLGLFCLLSFSINAQGILPSAVPSLEAWYRSDTNITHQLSDSSIISWGDISGNGHNADAYSVYRAEWAPYQMGDYPAIYYSGGTRTQINPPISDLYGFTYMAIISPDDVGVRGLMGGASTDMLSFYNSNRMVCNNNSGSGTHLLEHDGIFQGGEYFLITVQADTSNGGFYFAGKNGQLIPDTAAYTNMPDSWSVMGAQSLGSYRFKGHFMEVAVFNGPLSDVDRVAVEDYFIQKYGPLPELGPDINYTYKLCPDTTVTIAGQFQSVLWSTGDTTNSIHITEPGTYWVEAVTGLSQVAYDTIVVSVPTFSLPNDTLICDYDSVYLDGFIGNNYNYSWNTGDTTASLWANASGMYVLTISDSGSCSLTDTFNLVVDSFASAVSLGPDTSFCSGNSIGLYSGSGISSYLWSTGDTTTTIEINSSATYSITVSNANACTANDAVNVNVVGSAPTVELDATIACFGDSTHFTDLSTDIPPSMIVDWVWDFGDGAFDSIQNPAHQYAAPGTYYIGLTVANDSGCVNSTGDTVLVRELPTADFSFGIYCAQTEAEFVDLSTPAPSEPITNWHWDFAGMDTSDDDNPAFIFPAEGTYEVSLTVSSASGCSSSTSDSIDIFPALVADFSTDRNCAGDTIFFSDETASFSVISWYWNLGDGSASNEPNPINIYAVADTYTVTLDVINAIGCESSITKDVAVLNPPTAAFADTAGCVNTDFPFVDLSSSSDEAISSWNWSTSNGASFTGPNPSYAFEDTGSYTIYLNVATESGCRDNASHIVEVLSPPTAAFGFNSTFGEAPLDLSFTNLSEGATNYLWDFGNGNTSTGATPTANYTSNGVYDITLYAYNSAGCVDEMTRSFNVTPTSLDLEINRLDIQETELPDGSTEITLSARLINVGTRQITSADLYVSLGGRATTIESWEGTLEVGQTMDYQLSTKAYWPANTQKTFLCLDARNTNEDIEDNVLNNSKCVSLEDELQLRGPYPNPAQQRLGFDIVLPDDMDVNVSIYNSIGQEVLQDYNFDGREGQNHFEMDLGPLMSGEYVMVIRYRQNVLTRQFAVDN